ncbi:MAG: transport system permease [Chloroflexi bacterium OLB15]|nr:MAG: transport system permease [Chloroflexi bacterium OLB15]
MTTLSAEQRAEKSHVAAVGAREAKLRFSHRWRWVFIALLLLVTAALALSLFVGSVTIPAQEVLTALLGGETSRAGWTKIVQDYRVPKALTALLSGAALATAGLLMQTLFRNPLADAYVLGISSGASLGVALVVLSVGVGTTTLLGAMGIAGDLAVVVAATLGSTAVLLIVLLLARRVQNVTTLLILGLMFGYITSALVSLLAHFAAPAQLRSFNNWSQGTFGDVTHAQLPIFACVILFGLLISAITAKPLNAMLLGEDYAASLGVNLRRVRYLTILSTALLAGVVTAFCGPIAFLGIAVPHLCRLALRTSSHNVLIPASILLGASIALIADLIAHMPDAQIVLPLNAVLALFGAPVVIWVILRQPGLRGAM